MKDKIKKLWEDPKIRELFVYLVFGVLTTAVNWAVYLLYAKLVGLEKMAQGSGQYLMLTDIGQVLGWVVAVLFAFFTNKKYVFQSTATQKTGALREFWLFVSARVASLLIFDLGLFSLLQMAGMNDKWDKLLMNVLVVIFNYIASKFVIFKKREKR